MMRMYYFCQSCVSSTCRRLFITHSYQRYCFQQHESHLQNSSRSYTMGQKERYMIVGLGNHDLPLTRHSVGMRLVNRLAKFLEVTFEKQKDCLGFVAGKELHGIHLILLKPKLPMNNNGTSVLKAASKYCIAASHIYLVHDDLEREVGKVSLKEKGSAGGHNGVRSVIQSLRTDDIPRIRIGIDRPTNRDEVSDYVLQKFPERETSAIHSAVDQGILRIAQHLSTRTGIPTARVFSDLAEDPSTLELGVSDCDSHSTGTSHDVSGNESKSNTQQGRTRKPTSGKRGKKLASAIETGKPSIKDSVDGCDTNFTEDTGVSKPLENSSTNTSRVDNDLTGQENRKDR